MKSDNYDSGKKYGFDLLIRIVAFNRINKARYKNCIGKSLNAVKFKLRINVPRQPLSLHKITGTPRSRR